MECGELSDKFEQLDEFGMPGPRYTCTQSAVFPIGSTQSATQTLPLVSIETDPTWSFDPDASCVSLRRADGNQTAPTPQPAPTTFISGSGSPLSQTPTTAAPQKRPTPAPMLQLPTTVAPQTRPTLAPILQLPSPTTVAPQTRPTPKPTIVQNAPTIPGGVQTNNEPPVAPRSSSAASSRRGATIASTVLLLLLTTLTAALGM